MIETIAPKFIDRQGGYTRVLRYKERPGDGASLSVLEFSTPIIIDVEEKRPKKKKEAKPVKEVKEVKEKKKKAPILPGRRPEGAEPEKSKRPASKEETKKEDAKEDAKKETPKKGGFLNSLRRFLKGDDKK